MHSQIIVVGAGTGRVMTVAQILKKNQVEASLLNWIFTANSLKIS
jgi:hypothetical protein